MTKQTTERERKILSVAYSLHTNYEQDREAFHTACYGMFSECPICGTEISK